MRLVKYRGYWAEFDPKTKKRTSLRTDDEVEAKEIFREREEYRRQNKETIGEIVRAYLDARAGKPSIRGMEDGWKAAEKTFGNIRPGQLSRQLCDLYARNRGDHGVSSGSIRKELGIIRQALRWHNPKTAPKIELPPPAPPKERHLTKAEFAKLLAACDTPHLKLFVQLALATGARKGAILDLTWDRVDLERGHIRLTKGHETNKRRATVPINETLKKALCDSKKGNLSGYVVEYLGKPVKDIVKSFRKACDKASGATIKATKSKGWKAIGGDKSFDDVTPHTLRHTAAVWMAEARIPMDEIAQYLGHTSTNITYRVYARYSPDYLKTAAKVLEW